MWIQLLLPQLGAPSLSSCSSFTVFCQAHSWLQGTLQKHITPSHFTTCNGRLQLFDWKMTCLPLIWHCASGQVHQPGCTVQYGMRPQTCCDLKALAPYPAGWTTTYSSEFIAIFCQSTIGDTEYGIDTFCRGEGSRKAEGFGLEVVGLRRVRMKNSTRTVLFHAKTYQVSRHDQQTMHYLPIILTTSMSSHRSWESLGNCQRIDCLPALQPTSALSGTSIHTKSLWQMPKRRNTSERQRIGSCNLHIHLKRCRNSMVNSCMHAWSYPWGELASQNWNICLGYSTIVLSYHAPVQKDFEQTWSGGSASFNNPSSQEKSLSLFPSMMRMLFQMPAQSLELSLPLEIGGGLGASS